MKNIFKIFIAGFIMSACTGGYIDPISEVAAGEDATAPQITITSPSGNLTIPFTDNATDLVFQYTVNDDIEIASVDIFLDNVKLASYSNFLDYRAFTDSYNYNNLGLGDHVFEVKALDKTGKSSVKTVSFNVSNQYVALFGEKMYVPFFGGNVFTDILNGINPTVVGSPKTVSGGYDGNAYQGTTDSYISYPLSGLYSNDNGISFTFWYNVNASPDRAGIITINDNADDSDENRKGGLRIFREGSATAQRIKVNVGTGEGESWNDGAEITVGSGWVHIAVTVSPTESKVYFNGVLQRTSTYTAFDFSQSTTMVVGSGAPSYAYWNHLSDLSLIDDLRVYDKALSEAEVLATKQ